MPLESIPPFVLITGAMTAMGIVHQAVNYLTTGKPKPTNADDWDRMLQLRDARVKAEAKVGRGGRRVDWVALQDSGPALSMGMQTANPLPLPPPPPDPARRAQAKR